MKKLLFLLSFFFAWGTTIAQTAPKNLFKIVPKVIIPNTFDTAVAISIRGGVPVFNMTTSVPIYISFHRGRTGYGIGQMFLSTTFNIELADLPTPVTDISVLNKVLTHYGLELRQ